MLTSVWDKTDVKDLKTILQKTQLRHSKLCPRQVLGARMGLAGAAALGLETLRRDKQLLVIVETDGCFVDGIEAATGCSVGRRTLRVEDYGKVGATFVDMKSGAARRLAPQPDVRQRAWFYAPEQEQRYDAQLYGYQRMPDDELFNIFMVELAPPVRDLVGQAGVRAGCDLCCEEIINRRQVVRGELTLCRACAGVAYYKIDKYSYFITRKTIDFDANIK